MKKVKRIRKQKVFGVQMPDDLQAWVRERAAQEHRTISATTERAIRAYRAMVEHMPQDQLVS